MSLVYARRGDGLGTRVLNLMYGRMFAQDLGLPFKICWPVLESRFYDQPDLLHAAELDGIIADRHVFKTTTGLIGELVDAGILNGMRLLRVRGAEDARSSDELLASLASADAIEFSAPCPVDVGRDRGASVEGTLQSYWREVNWSPAFLARVDAFATGLGPGGLATAVAVHVRRGDLLTMLRQADLDMLRDTGMAQIVQRFAPLSSYAAAIDGLPGEPGPILVCGQDRATAEYFRARYPGRAVLSSLDEAMSETQRAFFDLLLLSRARTVIAPALSYFSSSAAAVGGGSLVALPHDAARAIPELFAQIEAGAHADGDALRALVRESYDRLEAREPDPGCREPVGAGRTVLTRLLARFGRVR